MRAAEYPTSNQMLLDFTKQSAERFWSDAGISFLTAHRNLNQNSLVFDVGGYLGDWTAAITKQYDCRVKVFEPVIEFYDSLKIRFEDNPKVDVFNFGLEDRNYSEQIALMNDASTMVTPGHREDAPFVQIRDISEFIRNSRIQNIDMISINCEGSEYGILNSLIDSGLIGICRIVQIQFHNFYPGAERERNAVRQRLSQTHKEKFSYPFTWEEFELR